MKRLRATLGAYAEPIQLGEGTPPSVIPVDKLRKELQAVIRTNTNYFLVCVAMTLGLYIAALWVVFDNLDDKGTLQIAFAMFGLSLAGMVRMMIGLWREKVATETLLTFVGAVDDKFLKSIIEVFLRQMPGGARPSSRARKARAQ